MRSKLCSLGALTLGACASTACGGKVLLANGVSPPADGSTTAARGSEGGVVDSAAAPSDAATEALVMITDSPSTSDGLSDAGSVHPCGNTDSDSHNCGACGHDCSALPHVNLVGVACVAGQCSYQCLAGYANCPSSSEGCVDLGVSRDNCGICDKHCAVACAAARCTAPAAIASGSSTTCTLLDGGLVDCWGGNNWGQLGTGSTQDSQVPVAVTGLMGVGAIAVGDGSTCAVLLNGSVECWGDNVQGQLGASTASNTFSSIPVTVTGLANVAAVSVGRGFACALGSNNTVECWGGNAHGQLGDGTNSSASSPVAVTNLDQVMAIAAGSAHACALLSDGTIKCWGENNYGQLGNGTSADSSTPVVVPYLGKATALAAGGNHTCAIQANGTIDCWGENSKGQLGNGGTYQSLVPVAVLNITGASAIAAGELETCALHTDGTLSCWGDNNYGELGTGSATAGSYIATPVKASALISPVSISVGYGFACALLSAGAVECWGSNSGGQLGDATVIDSATPVAVSW